MASLPSLSKGTEFESPDKPLNLETNEDQHRALKKTPIVKKAGVPESARLQKLFFNPNKKDVNATVGVYDPFPVSWVNPVKNGVVNLSKGAARFPYSKEKKQVGLGPGTYPDANKSIKKPIIVGSPFQSTTPRFKEKINVSKIAPGSYELYPQKVQRGWKPFVVTLASRLGRIIEPIPDVSMHKNELDLLSGDSKKNNFITTKARMKKSFDAQQTITESDVIISKPKPLYSAPPVHNFDAGFIRKQPY